MTYNHSHTVRVPFFPYQNHYKTSRASKLNQNWFAPLGGCSSPPGSSLETQKLSFYACVAWRPESCRQAVPLQEPRNFAKLCVTLATLKARQAVSEKFPKTHNYEFNRGKICIFIQTQLQYITTN